MRGKRGSVLLIVVIAGVIGAYIGYRCVGPPAPPEVDRIIHSESVVNPEVARFYTAIKAGLTSLSAAISAVLLYIYASLYRKMRSEFTLGLMVSTFALMVYAVTANPIFHHIIGHRAVGPGPVLVIPDFFITLALGVLLYLALK